MTDFILDYQRPDRVGFGEAIFCSGKTPAQIDAIVTQADGVSGLLLTRLDLRVVDQLITRDRLDYDPLSRTAFLPPTASFADTVRDVARGCDIAPACTIAIVTAGTSDLPVAREAARTLAFNGIEPRLIADVGVAGLWRLMRRIEELRRIPVMIVVAGMDAALPTVIGGLVPGCVIAVPTSVGYGVATGGRTALDAMLASCAPGVTVVNIDNGYGAACAALRIARAIGGR